MSLPTSTHPSRLPVSLGVVSELRTQLHHQCEVAVRVLAIAALHVCRRECVGLDCCKHGEDVAQRVDAEVALYVACGLRERGWGRNRVWRGMSGPVCERENESADVIFCRRAKWEAERRARREVRLKCRGETQGDVRGRVL